jgi:hypothetical protein
MSFSLKQAAAASGKSKPTILRAIQAGKISAEKDEQGEWQIDPAELHRVYEPVPERNGANEVDWNDSDQIRRTTPSRNDPASMRTHRSR